SVHQVNIQERADLGHQPKRPDDDRFVELINPELFVRSAIQGPEPFGEPIRKRAWSRIECRTQCQAKESDETSHHHGQPIGADLRVAECLEAKRLFELVLEKVCRSE